jgi:4-amino-4-deoxy-L-arabinose transferase-like glycosyltransferase
VHFPSLDSLASGVLAAASLLLRQLLAGAVLTVTACVAGRTLLGWLGVVEAGNRRAGTASEPRPRVDPGGAGETAAVAISLGLVVVAEVGLLLGLSGLLKPGAILLAVLGIHLASLPAWRSLLRGLGGLAGRLGGRAEGGGEAAARRRGRRHLLWLVGGAAAALLPTALLTLYPPTAFDATLYHLPFARAFASSGALVPFLPDLRMPAFPQLVETLFAMLLLFGGNLATQAVSLLATMLTVALLLVWGRRASPAAGWIAAAAYAGSPLVIYLAGTAYVEPSLVLFATAAFYAVSRWREGAGSGWLTLAAIFAGAAADTKYLGLFVVGLVAVAAVAAAPPGPRVSRWRRLGGVALAFGIVAAPWYGRIVAATGNPVFPYLPRLFGSSPWAPPIRHGFDLPALAAGVAVRLLRLPWDAVFARSRLGGYPPYSPVFLLTLPALLAGALARRRVRALLLAAAAYTVLILALLPDARYLLVVLPLVCLAVGDSLAWSLAWLASRLPLAFPASHRPLPSSAPLSGLADGRPPGQGWVDARAALLALAIFLPGWGYSLFSLYRLGPVPVTPAEREAFLARKLPMFSSIRYLDRVCGNAYTLYAIHAENMVYLAAGRFLGDLTGPAAYRLVVPADGDAELLYRRLRSLGADHLLTVEGDPALPPIFTAAFDRLFRLVYADGRARLFALRGTSCGSISRPGPSPQFQRPARGGPAAALPAAPTFGLGSVAAAAAAGAAGSVVVSVAARCE